MKCIFKLYINCGRMGELEGLFISTKEKVNKLIESEIQVYFGEVLGKHSEVFGAIEDSDIKMLTDSEEAVKLVEECKLQSGHNPFHYTATGVGEKYEGAIVDEIIEDMLKDK